MYILYYEVKMQLVKQKNLRVKASISHFATDALWSQVVYFKVTGQYYLRWG